MRCSARPSRLAGAALAFLAFTGATLGAQVRDISGTWHFRAGDDSTWARPGASDAGWDTASLPAFRSRSVTSPIAWLRRTIPAQAGAPLRIGIGPAHDAYEVFANGTRVGAYGVVGPSPHAAQPVARSYEVPASVIEGGSVTIAIRIWTSPVSAKLFTGAEPLIGGPLIIGAPDAVADRIEVGVSRRNNARLPVFAVVAIAFFVGLYHLHLFRRRRELHEYLWYGGVCLGAAGFLWAFSYVTYSAGERFETGARLVNMISSLTWFGIIGFVSRILAYELKPWQRLYMRAQLVFAAIFLLPIAFDTMLLVSLVAVYQMLPGFIAVLVLIARRAWNGHAEARTISIGFAIAVAAVIYDNIIVWMMGSESMRLEPFGLAAVILAMALSLANRFTRLYGDLDERNATLARFNASATRFVPDEFLSLLGRGSVVEIQRGDHVQRQMGVLFSDIRGFTTLVESMGEQESFRFINEYLESMEVPIVGAGGFINQYIGDAIMALFDKAPERSVQAALGLAAAVAPFNARRATRGFPPIRIGVGIESGPLMLGTIGGSRRLDCGVISDTVNTAARIESLTSTFGATVLVGEDVWGRLAPNAKPESRVIGRVRPKGKDQAVTIRELLDAEPEERRVLKLATRETFESGWTAYAAGAFGEAMARFTECATRDPADAAARFYVAECGELIARPQPASWDGAMRLQTK